MAEDLPNGPLLNATLDCEKKYKGVLYQYNIRGYRWDEHTEKQIKAACNAGNAAMTKWEFESWEVRDCGDGTQFRRSLAAGHEIAMVDEFRWPTGAYGDVNHASERAAWVITHGTTIWRATCGKVTLQVVATPGASESEVRIPLVLPVVIVRIASLLRSGKDYRLNVVSALLGPNAVGSTSSRLISDEEARSISYF
ncbi:hypothetical protein MBLNU13_g07596t1 [Cladosporium sp. NU13]